jgi:hypothetical protein
MCPMAILLLTVVAIVVVGCLITQPMFKSSRLSEKNVDSERLREHVVMVCETFHLRDWHSVEDLDKCAA